MSTNMDQATPAQTVGNQFVSQYYTVLHSSPKHLHRFYSDRSTLTYADVIPEGDSITQNLKTATGQKLIHETVMNLGYVDTMTEIYSVDSQYSKDGGVVVQVTGALQAKGKDRRPFVQTFFLAVQEKGYFVLNDIFRYLLPPGVISGMLDEEEDKEEVDAEDAAADAPASAEKNKEETTSTTSPKPDMARLKVSDTPESTPSPLEAARAAAAAAAVSATTKSDKDGKDATTTTTIITKDLQRQTSGGPSAVPTAPGVTVPFGPLVPGEVEGGTAGANGVSIVYGGHRLSDNSDRQGSPEEEDTSVTSSATPKVTAAATAAATTAAAGARSSGTRPPPPLRPDGSASVSVSSIKSIDSPGPDSMDPPPTEGVFIRDIPHAVTVEQLAEALAQYGPINEGSLSLKTQPNRDSYAFVDYENAEDAAECLAHGMEFLGRKVTVETKRPHIFKASGGGGGGSGMRNNNAAHAMNALGGLAGLQYPTSPMQMQYPTSPMHLQHHQYQQYQGSQQQHSMQHNARVSNGGGSLGGSAGGYNTNRQHGMSNGRGANSAGNAQMQMHQQRSAMPLQNPAAAYQMAAAGGYPVMMYNPMTPGMTYMLPPNQAAMLMAQQQQDSPGSAVGVGVMDAGVYGSMGAGMQSMGNRGGRGNTGGVNGRYDSAGGRGGRGGGAGQQRGGSDQHSPYGRASLGQQMPYA